MTRRSLLSSGDTQSEYRASRSCYQVIRESLNTTHVLKGLNGAETRIVLGATSGSLQHYDVLSVL